MAKMYLVDLSRDSCTDMSESYLIAHGKEHCDCPDWPRVRLCKHIAAVAHFFPGPTQPTAAPKSVPQVHERSVDSCDASLAPPSSSPILKNLISVSQGLLSDGLPSSPGTVWSLRLVESHLTAIAQHSRAAENSPLPDRESLPPNQRTWTETAKRMGATKRKRARPTDTSPPVKAAEWIGPLNRKQTRKKITDPYSGGTRSGRDTAPDAQTAAQNAEARAHPGSPPPKRRRKRVGSPLPSSAPQPLASAPPAAWYPTHPAYPYSTHPAYGAPPPPAWSHPAYHIGAYPYAWPSHFPPSQTYYPNTQ